MNLSTSEANAFLEQFYRCWTPPIGVHNIEKMNVSVRVKLEKDGTVTSVELVQTNLSGSDKFYRAFADSAVRAVWKCNPLQHTPPKEKYGIWQEVVLMFKPKDMY